MVSIIMGTLNRGHLIKESLDSIIRQTYSNWECLIIDDGGSDNTSEVLETYLKDGRIKYFKREPAYKQGLSGCRNNGLDRAAGEFIVFFDDDDIVHPLNLESCVKEFSGQEISYCRYIRKVFMGDFSESYNWSQEYQVEKFDLNKLENIIIGETPLNSCQVMWRKECFFNIRFNENLQYAEEWECYSRILSSGLKGVNILKVLYFGRKHAKSNTGEFWNNNPKRRASKTIAAKLIIENLKNKKLLSPRLVKYFIQLSFFLKEPTILNHTLSHSGANWFTRKKYVLGYKFYPLIRPILRLKGKFLV